MGDRVAERPSSNHYVTFTVGDSLYGIDVAQVQEALSPQARTPVPLAHDVVAGLVNLRGQVVLTIDLRRRLGLPPLPADDDRDPMVVVVLVDGEPISLLVDGVGEVVDVAERAFERLPQTLDGPVRDLVRGTYTLPDRLLLVLDVEQATAV